MTTVETSEEKEQRDKEFAEAQVLAENCRKLYEKAWKDGKLSVDLSGHCCDKGKEKFFWERLFSDEYPFLQYGVHDRIKAMRQALINPIATDVDIPRNWYELKGVVDECHKCGEHVHFFTNGREIRTLLWDNEAGGVFEINGYRHRRGDYYAQPCKYSDGIIEEIKHSVDVPSGKIVMGNNLHGIFDDKVIFPNDSQYQHEFSINHDDGQINYMGRYAEHGLLTGFVGSGSVDVYARKDMVVVGRYGPDSTPKTITYDKKKLKYVTRISMGLWWYGAADFDLCHALNNEEAEKIDCNPKDGYYGDRDLFSLPVTPGKYERTHFYRRMQANKRGAWSVIRRI